MMDPRLHLQVIAGRQAAPVSQGRELFAAQEPRRTRLPRRGPPPENPIRLAVTVRIAAADDQVALWRLAELDSATPPRAPVLIGEVAGRPAAALSLADGAVIADPFTATSELVELLRLRARQLHADRGASKSSARRAIAILFGRMTSGSELPGSASFRDT